MMRRRFLLAAASLLAGCKNPNLVQEILPMTLGEWRRLSVENTPPEEYPAELKQRGIKRARRGTFTGKGRIFVSIYEFAGQAVAFEMVQKWKPEAGKMAFHEGPYFVVLEATEADNKAMNQFATLLESSLKK